MKEEKKGPEITGKKLRKISGGSSGMTPQSRTKIDRLQTSVDGNCGKTFSLQCGKCPYGIRGSFAECTGCKYN